MHMKGRNLPTDLMQESIRTHSNQRHRHSQLNGQPNSQTSSYDFPTSNSEPFHSDVNILKGSMHFDAFTLYTSSRDKFS